MGSGLCSHCTRGDDLDPLDSNHNSLYKMKVEEYKKVASPKKKGDVNSKAMDLALTDLMNTFKPLNNNK